MDKFYTKKEYEKLLADAGNGDVSAQYQLGYIYETGNISDMTEKEREELKNLYEALDWYESAATDGWSIAEVATNRLKVYLKEKSKLSKEEIERRLALANEDDLESLIVVGCGLLSGENGWRLSTQRGEKYLKKAISLGSVEACVFLAHYCIFSPRTSFVNKEKCLEYCDLAEKMGGENTEIELIRDMIRLMPDGSETNRP